LAASVLTGGSAAFASVVVSGRGELLDCLGDFDSPPAEASVVVPMMTMMYYILGRAARLTVLDWTGSVGWVAVRAAKMEEDEKVK
jgi:hypothetical protein